MTKTITTQPLPHITSMLLSATQSQQVFRALLTALSEPGRIAQLPTLDPSVLPALWLPLALADVDVTIAVGGSDPTQCQRLEALISEVTSANAVEIPGADLVALIDTTTPLTEIKRADLYTPEEAARISLQIATVVEGQGKTTCGQHLEVKLTGPGVNGERHLQITPTKATTDTSALDDLAELLSQCGTNSGTFPAGFDIWLFSELGEVVALSRTTEIEIVNTVTSGQNAAAKADALNFERDEDDK